MGFADDYLLKAGLRESLFHPDPHPDLKITVTIPVHNESGLERCLDSLFIAGTLPGGKHGEVLILINAASNAPDTVLNQNLQTLADTEKWIAAHPHPFLKFYVVLDHSFGKKEAGVGVARKILMDEAVRRFDTVGNFHGIIASLDADAELAPNYLDALLAHFEISGKPIPEGCSIRFEHPLEGKSFSPAIYDAISQYELHLRYYLAAVRSTTYPFAYHTVGSAFAVRADIYCLEGGMNKRQGGEDFYFIQKVAMRGKWSECTSTRVIPSPRPSNRVPFGTGPVVERLLRDTDSAGNIPALTTYHPEPFAMLKEFFADIKSLYSPSSDFSEAAYTAVLSDFLAAQGFREALDEMRGNSGSPDAFLKRFWRWFNMFRIMKFLHYAREHGYPHLEVSETAADFLSMDKKHTARQLLKIFRDRELQNTEC